MSNKNQNSRQLSTEEKLEFFIERAEVLSRYFSENFPIYDIMKFAISRNTNIVGDEWKFHTLTYGLICLIRLFFLPSEKIVLYPIKQVTQRNLVTHRKLQPTDIPLRKLSNEPSWCEAVDQAIEAINQLFYGIGTPLDAEPLNLPYIRQVQRTLAVPQEIAQPLLQRLAYLKRLTNIRKGELPKISTSLQLESDELCHLETSATYHKVNAKSITPVSGRLVATSKRLHFLSATRGTTISWNNIMKVEVRPHHGVYLELAKGTGNGLYSVSDPMLVGAVLDTLVKISKRQLVMTKTDTSRHIPQDVKNAVWQRDGGKCAQCGAEHYLEYDHIIPFSKGGANSVANVQLLCRSCNLKKSDRI